MKSVAPESLPMTVRRLQVLAYLDCADTSLQTTNATHYKSFLWHLTKARQSHNRGSSLSTLDLSASSVRHDLTATCRLIEVVPSTATRESSSTTNEPPNLIPTYDDEDAAVVKEECNDKASQKPNGADGSGGRVMQFKLVNLLDPQAEAAATTTTTTATAASSATSIDDAPTASVVEDDPQTPSKTMDELGLRQRRGKTTEAKTSSSGWTQDDHNSSSPAPAGPSAKSPSHHKDHSGSISTSVRDPLELFGGGLVSRELHVAQEHAQRALEGYVRAANARRQLLHILQTTEQQTLDRNKSSTSS